jgi:hypothetical protein
MNRAGRGNSDYTNASPPERWEDFYARALLEHFS